MSGGERVEPEQSCVSPLGHDVVFRGYRTTPGPEFLPDYGRCTRCGQAWGIAVLEGDRDDARD